MTPCIAANIYDSVNLNYELWCIWYFWLG